MTIRHQKISGEDNTDPDLVGGEDWDADHALGEDTMLPVSGTSLVWNSGYSTMSTYARSRGTSLVTRDSAGIYYSVAQLEANLDACDLLLDAQVMREIVAIHLQFSSPAP